MESFGKEVFRHLLGGCEDIERLYLSFADTAYFFSGINMPDLFAEELAWNYNNSICRLSNRRHSTNESPGSLRATHPERRLANSCKTLKKTQSRWLFIALFPTDFGPSPHQFEAEAPQHWSAHEVGRGTERVGHLRADPPQGQRHEAPPRHQHRVTDFIFEIFMLNLIICPDYQYHNCYRLRTDYNMLSELMYLLDMLLDLEGYITR